MTVAGGEQAALGARLRDVYWIGGGSGAGKSTIARRLAARHGLRLYATDAVMADHGRRSSPVDSPFMARFAAMDMDERWVSRSPQTMLETFGWFRGEGFGLIVEDLLRRPAGPGVTGRLGCEQQRQRRSLADGGHGEHDALHQRVCCRRLTP